MIIKIDSQTTVVFDLDDTLYKEIDYLKSAYIEIAQNLSPNNWKQTYAHMFALYRKGENVFDHLEITFKTDKNTLITTYRDHKPSIYLEPSSKILFNTIKNHGAKLALLTDGRSITQRNKIHALGLLQWFDKVIISDEIGSEKPSVKNFKTVENDCKTQKYYYIADNLKKDFVTPNVLGWGTVGLIDNGLNIHSYPEYFDKKNYKPQDFIFSLSDIVIEDNLSSEL